VTTMSPYFDPHMLLPMFDFLIAGKLYAAGDLEAAKLSVASNTNLAKKDTAEFKTTEEALKGECKPLLDIIQGEVVSRLLADKLFTAGYLDEEFGVTEQMIQSLFKYAKFSFEAGDYALAADCLHFYRMLDNTGNAFPTLWGKLAADILANNWDAATDGIRYLLTAIDNKSASSLLQLQQRSWLAHWSLFVYTATPGGLPKLVEFFMQEKMLNAVQTNCPWLLRYLTVAVICCKRHDSTLRDLVKVVEQEKRTYSDPITELLLAVYSEFNFELAQEKLLECKQVLAEDFFLSKCDTFQAEAQKLIFETYCRIHETVEIPLLSARLGVEEAEAERWIVELIRNVNLQAKIDSNENAVMMSARHSDVYQQVIERSKDLTFRSYVLSNNVEQRVKETAAAK
jgi:translation initiation factor 3 subunit E